MALTTFGTRDYIVAALSAGAAGYLVKDATGDDIKAGLAQALRGEMPLSTLVRAPAGAGGRHRAHASGRGAGGPRVLAP